MNRIEEMIKEMCPDGVRRVKLGDYCKILRGKRLTKAQLSDKEKYPVLHGGATPMGYYNEYNRKANTTVVVNTGNAGSVFFYDSEFWSSDACFSLYPNEQFLDKYLYLCVYGCEKELKNKIRAGAMPTIDSLAVESLRIPLPPLPIQQEIVKILDSFTALQQNLEDELKLRQKQYEHYREKLLTFEDGECEWKKLGDIASFKYGFTDKAKDNGDTRYVRITDITNDGHLCTDDAKYVELTEESKPYLLKKDDLVMARTGATFGKTLLYQEDYQSIYASFLIKIVFETNVVVPKYYWIFTKSSRYWLQANKLVGGGAQPQFNANALAEIFVPVPPIETQLQITQTLDHFESLISNIKTEIELRKKQYEYYREKLLTF